MPNWKSLILTQKGADLQAKAEIGRVLEFTCIKVGSGILSQGEKLEELTDLVKVEQVLGIADKVFEKEGTCEITSSITNSDLTEGYFCRELGIYANDPDLGEILYAVTIDDSPDYIPAKGTATAISQQFALHINFGNAEHVIAYIDVNGIATVGYVQSMIKTIKRIVEPTIDEILEDRYVPSPEQPDDDPDRDILTGLKVITNEDIDNIAI